MVQVVPAVLGHRVWNVGRIHPHNTISMLKPNSTFSSTKQSIWLPSHPATDPPIYDAGGTAPNIVRGCINSYATHHLDSTVINDGGTDWAQWDQRKESDQHWSAPETAPYSCSNTDTANLLTYELQKEYQMSCDKLAMGVASAYRHISLIYYFLVKLSRIIPVLSVQLSLTIKTSYLSWG